MREGTENESEVGQDHFQSGYWAFGAHHAGEFYSTYAGVRGVPPCGGLGLDSKIGFAASPAAGRYFSLVGKVTKSTLKGADPLENPLNVLFCFATT